MHIIVPFPDQAHIGRISFSDRCTVACARVFGEVNLYPREAGMQGSRLANVEMQSEQDRQG